MQLAPLKLVQEENKQQLKMNGHISKPGDWDDRSKEIAAYDKLDMLFVRAGITFTYSELELSAGCCVDYAPGGLGCKPTRHVQHRKLVMM